MASVPDRIDPPEQLRGALLDRLADEGLLRARGSRPVAAHRRRPLALAAGIALAFLGGALGGGFGVTAFQERAAPIATDPHPRFLLLLYQDDGFDPQGRTGMQIVEEYGSWAGDLAARNQLVSAEKLGEDGRLVGGAGEAQGIRSGETLAWEAPELSGPEGALGGFLLIRAASYEEAVEIAAASPHVRYGGAVVIRRVDEGGSP